MEPQFPFPFEPYPIQEKFMKELYFTIEKNNLGIFESPTGTGKSLSICCGALQWLRDHTKKIYEDLEKEIMHLKLDISSNTGSDDWLQEEYEKIKKNQTLEALQCKLDRIKKRQELFSEIKNRVVKHKSNVRTKTLESYFQNIDKSKNTNVEDNTVMENKENASEHTEEDKDLILEELADKEQNGESDEEEIKDDEQDDFTKIYISSRTHSQLSQFIGEIKRTVFKEDTRVVTLASRQHYCINSDVTKLKNVNLINERCLELQKSKTKTTSVGEEGKALKKSKTKSCTACPYYNQNNIAKLKDRMLVDILDMEDLVKCGKELKACPYYAARMALDDAEVVFISHAGIVSSGARSGVSLKLQNNVLILDEAHGLTAALENAHSAPVSAKQLSSVKTFLQFYINKYRSRLSSKNLLTLNQIYFVVGKLLDIIKPKSTSEKREENSIFTLEDFVIKAEIDHMNLRPLVEFCRSTRLAPKLHGFSVRYSQQALEEEANKAAVKKTSFQSFLSNISKKKQDVVEEVQPEVKQDNQAQVPTETSAGSGLYAIMDFLERLCDRSSDGRVLANYGEQNNAQLKYLLLNPAEHFSLVVTQCRSVIVAGGTMEPISEFKALLSSEDDRVNIVRCDHVVPPDNVLAICLSRGPSNLSLNFSYENRMSNELLNEVGRILRNICSIVPGGVVCFLPSYSYEQTVYDHLKKSNVIETITKKKTVFREPKSAAEVDQVLHKFALAVKNKNGDHNGALMLSVVGGKLSEGLNFSDDLGRCVIVVGMPYPNVKSAELQEKMSYLNTVTGRGAGNIYYENLCMKAVNQCIGECDDLGRCVIVVGMPYPNVKSAELQEKMSYLNTVTGRGAGNIYYENLCSSDTPLFEILWLLKSILSRAFVNEQLSSSHFHSNILRSNAYYMRMAVRHANDYACVLLVDDRYSRPQTISALPSFVQKSLLPNCSFGATIGNIAKFFSRHKEKR